MDTSITPLKYRIFDAPEEPTQIERLAFPKFAIVGETDRLQQLLSSAYAQYLIHLDSKR